MSVFIHHKLGARNLTWTRYGLTSSSEGAEAVTAGPAIIVLDPRSYQVRIVSYRPSEPDVAQAPNTQLAL